MTVIQSALMILPVVLPQSLASIASGQYMSRTNRYGEVIWVGFSLWVTATVVESRFSRTFPLAGMVVVLVIQGAGVGFTFQPTLVAAQAHSAKADRAVVISSRNFLRSLGGASGLAVASALYSNTVVSQLPSSPTIPETLASEIKSSVFSVPDLSGLTESQKNAVLDTYTLASRSVFYFWIGCISCCWLLMFFIKDKGLQRKEETQEAKKATDAEAQGPVAECQTAPTSVEDDTAVEVGDTTGSDVEKDRNMNDDHSAQQLK